MADGTEFQAVPRIDADVVAERATGVSAPAGMSCKIVGIDGPGGAGKSTLAGHVARVLGARVICTDDFADWANPLDWWPRLIEQVLDPLSRNRPGRYQRFDWETGKLAEWHDVAVDPFLIIEGVSASRRAFARYLSLTVWVETPREERLRRGLERDGPGALRRWEQWMAREDDYVAAERPHERADLVVSGVSETP
ncbi:MAG TPA: hypothetical protein VFP55_04250 [Solirubrobacteraceae bacterium]|nr:hypothetical protein [Solirubrobacteraceae bacterium]